MYRTGVGVNRGDADARGYLDIQVERRGLMGSELAARRAGMAEASNARSSMMRTAAE